MEFWLDIAAFALKTLLLVGAIGGAIVAIIAATRQKTPRELPAIRFASLDERYERAEDAFRALALGRKESREPFNSEDLALLTAVAGQVATAIENGRLYRQLHLKAIEIGRIREFSDNILESLDDGLLLGVWNQRAEAFAQRRATFDHVSVSSW